MISTIEAIHAHQVNADGSVTILNPSGITTYLQDGTYRPAIVGDVYSVQPHGSVQGRVAGTHGAYEQAVTGGSSVVFAPLGAKGSAYLLAPFAATIPNA